MKSDSKRRAKQRQKKDHAAAVERRRRLARERHQGAVETHQLESLASNISARTRLKTRTMGEALRTLAKAPAAFARAIVSPSAFPISYDDLELRLPTYSTTLSHDLQWLAVICVWHAEQVRNFLQIKRRFEHAFLADGFDRASDALTHAQSSLGVSLWLLQSNLLLAQAIGGLPANREHLQTASTQNSVPVTVFGTFFSQRAETYTTGTTASYIADFEKAYAYISRRNDLRSYMDYARFHLLFANMDDFKSLSATVHRESISTIVDVYESLIRICQILSLDTNAQTESRGAIRDIVTLLCDRGFDDERLRLLKLILSPSASVHKTNIGDTLMDLIDSYTVGNYAHVIGEAVKGIQTRPDVFEFYELHARSAIHLQKGQDSCRPYSLPNRRLLDALRDALEAGERRNPALEIIRSIALALDAFPIGAQAIGFLRRHEPSARPIDPISYSALNGAAPTPRLSRAFQSTEQSSDYLESLARIYPSSPSIALFAGRSASGVGAPDTIPRHRRLIHEATALARSGRDADALPLFGAALASSSGLSIIVEEAVSGLFRSYLAAARLNECAMLVSSEFLDRPGAIAAVPVDTLLRAAESAPHLKDGKNIAWPIVSFISESRRGGPPNSWNIYLAYDDFMTASGVSRPKALSDIASRFERRQLIAFLRLVCTLDVLDNSIEFESTDDLESERIGICQQLLALDPPNADAYSGEISKLTQASMLRRALHQLNQSKVYVDVEGIERSLDVTFEQRFLRFLLFSNLTARLRRAHHISVSSRRAHDASSDIRNFIVVDDVTIRQLREIFDEIKARFISSNEHGLDSYLSIRIRHGTLSGQIRSVFERENLLTQKKGDGPAYSENTFWRSQVFDSLGSGASRRADMALAKFSGTVDDTIELVKQRWIQIKGPANNGEGLFDFDYDDHQFGEFYADVIGVRTFGEFLTRVFSELWRRTESNLRNVVTQIRTELHSRLQSALSRMASEVYAIDDSLRYSPFAIAITRCSSQIANELDVVAAWFQTYDAKNQPDFQLPLLGETAIQTIRNCFPTCTFATSQSIDDITCRGAVFTNFADLMFILLENIVKHSSSNQLRATMSMNIQGDRLIIKVTNVLDPSVNLEAVRSRVKRISSLDITGQFLTDVRREGGSGYAKLHKILRVDLGRGDDYAVDVGVGSDAVFTATIWMLAEGIVA